MSTAPRPTTRYFEFPDDAGDSFKSGLSTDGLSTDQAVAHHRMSGYGAFEGVCILHHRETRLTRPTRLEPDPLAITRSHKATKPRRDGRMEQNDRGKRLVSTPQRKDGLLPVSAANSARILRGFVAWCESLFTIFGVTRPEKPT